MPAAVLITEPPGVVRDVSRLARARRAAKLAPSPVIDALIRLAA